MVRVRVKVGFRLRVRARVRVGALLGDAVVLGHPVVQALDATAQVLGQLLVVQLAEGRGRGR